MRHRLSVALPTLDRMSDITTLFPAGLDALNEQVELTDDEGWAAASPCEGWTALDVLAHVTGTLQKALAAMGGGEYAGVAADAASGDGIGQVVQRWRQSAASAADAILTADPRQVVPTPRGDQPLAQALALPVADLAVHAWDIAASGGRDLELPHELRVHVERLVEVIPPQALRSEGVFGPELDAPPGAGPTERLMAFLGRRGVSRPVPQ